MLGSPPCPQPSRSLGLSHRARTWRSNSRPCEPSLCRHMPAATHRGAPSSLHVPQATLSPPASRSPGELGVPSRTAHGWEMGGPVGTASPAPHGAEPLARGLAGATQTLSRGSGRTRLLRALPWQGEQPEPPRPCGSAPGALPEASLGWGVRAGTAETMEQSPGEGQGGEGKRWSLPGNRNSSSQDLSLQRGDMGTSCWERHLWGKGGVRLSVSSGNRALSSTAPSCTRQCHSSRQSRPWDAAAFLGNPCAVEPGRPHGLAIPAAQHRDAVPRSLPWPKGHPPGTPHTQGVGNSRRQITAGTVPQGPGAAAAGKVPGTPHALRPALTGTLCPCRHWPSPHRLPSGMACSHSPRLAPGPAPSHTSPLLTPAAPTPCSEPPPRAACTTPRPPSPPAHAGCCSPHCKASSSRGPCRRRTRVSRVPHTGHTGVTHVGTQLP